METIINFVITLYFYLFFLYAFIIDTLIALPLKILFLNSRYIHYILVLSGKILLFISGCRLNIKKEFDIEDGKYLIVSNHQSIFDILVLYTILGNRKYRWIVKDTLFYMPFLGILMKMAGYISINRLKKYKAYKSIQKAVKILEKDASIVIFPEGTRSRDDTINNFKSGSIKIAIESGANILPIVLKNTLYIKRRGSFLVKPMKIYATILKPFITHKGKLKEQRILLQALHKKMLAAYKNMR